VTHVVVDDHGLEGRVIYRYDVVISLSPLGTGETRMRASVQGTESRGGVTMKAGPVRDPAFFEAFFAALEYALELDFIEVR
jgi:hypothetical protein